MSLTYRADIDGLRALAVLAVVVYHAFPELLSGGFIGVDVFFVISGYLITSIIFQELEDGRFSFTTFLSRRVRRIFPALLLVMFTALAIGWFYLLRMDYHYLGRDVAGGVAFITNFIHAAEAGYFDRYAATKPMLHLWSLGVEEQFYLVWPLILWLAWRQNTNLFALTLIVAIISFAANIALLGIDLKKSFFWPYGRLWELLSGSLLGWELRRRSAPFSKVTSCWMSVVGVCLLAYGSFEINEKTIFPGVWVLVPVTAALLMIAAGNSAWLNRKLLMNPLAVWLGLISYPLYLWHWPILAFLRLDKGGELEVSDRLIAVTDAIVLAWLTYVCVEKPVRHHLRSRLQIFATLLPVAMLIGGFGVLVDQYIIANTTDDSTPPKVNWRKAEALCSEIFPTWNQREDNKCMLQSRTNQVALIGDSHAQHLFTGLSEEMAKQGKSVAVFPASCQAPLRNVSSAYYSQNPRIQNMRMVAYQFINQAFDYILKTPEITHVILSHNPYCDARIQDVSHPEIKQYKNILQDAFKRTLSELKAHRKKVIIILDNPRLKIDPRACVERPLTIYSPPAECIQQETVHRLRSRLRTYARIVHKVAPHYDNVKVIDLADVLCHDGACPVMIDGKRLYWDISHLTNDGSRYVAPYIAKELD